MCGIAGLVGPGARNDDIVRAMTDAIRHRGPDDYGYWTDSDASVALGHRRLSIVDLSPHGHQPMVSSDGRWVICYNGEVYNHRELRAQLDGGNHSPEGGWRGQSDTETLIQAIASWGLQETLRHCTGMFAFALWDRRERTLNLVRDRFGEKPLYYGWAGRDFLFGSELKAVARHPQFDRQIDRQSLARFLSRNNVPAPLSIYRGIFKLPPGCILTVSSDAGAHPSHAAPLEGAGGPVRLSRYWAYAEVVREGLADQFADEVEAIDTLDAALNTAISGQSVADVPVGAFLSGGIDSSTIVALYQKYSAQPVRSFSIGFDEAGYDEAGYAKAVAAHLGTDHHEQYVTVQAARDVIPDLPAMYDEPFADSSQIPTYLVSRFARQQVTVALTGDGGDELFAGYNRHVMVPGLWRKLDRIPFPIRALGSGMAGRLPAPLLSKVMKLLGSRRPDIGGKAQRALMIAGAAKSLEEVYAGLVDEWAHHGSPVLGTDGRPDAGLALDERAPDSVRLMYQDAVDYLPNDILCKVDRASMAVSLETRIPFLDHRVAAIAARIPPAMLIRDGQGKQILRKLLFREAPKELFDRPKAGFAVPVGSWIKGPLRPWAEEYLKPSRLAAQGWLDVKAVTSRWHDHLAGRRDSSAALWSILMFQAWLDANQD